MNASTPEPMNDASPASATNATNVNAPDTFGAALGRVLRQPTFLIAAVVLLVAAVGLNAAVGSMKLYFKKEPVPLAKELGAIPNRFGPWVQVSLDKALDKDTQDVLGTDKYIFRDYVDTRKAGDLIADMKDLPEDKRLEKLGQVRNVHPDAVIRLSVTYYTGMVDTVAHVPDRCVTADGFEPTSYNVLKWGLARDLSEKAKQDGDNVDVRYIRFEDQSGAARVQRNIAYFFHANGRFMSDPLSVRQELGKLWIRKGYYAKIETMTTVENEDHAREVTADFLTAAMPDIHKCMPDWSEAAPGDGSEAMPKVAQR